MSPAEQVADTVRPVKHCACGATYDRAAWRELRLVGMMDDGDGGELELRDCSCGSTIAIELPNRQDGDRALAPPEREAPMSAVRLCPVGGS